MASEWYYTTNKQQMGPVSWDELRELAQVGILKPADLVWSEGMAEWIELREFEPAPTSSGGNKLVKTARQKVLTAEL